jgi:tetratricopeptide (TPR) repeat protein
MGYVIKPDTKGGSTTALEKTGKGGLLSKGYLRDAPASAYLGDDETPAFVLTNGEEGVVSERDDRERRLRPGNRYRTIVVVSDRRIVVLVGNANDGDERIMLPLAEVTEATVEEHALVLSMASGETWRIPAGGDDIEPVAEYVEGVAAAWDDLEDALAGVKRTLVTATAEADAGEYEDGIEHAQAAHDDVTDLEDVLSDVPGDWPVDALTDRLERVHSRCVETLADVRIGHARSLADRAEREWSAGEFELAHDLFDRARAEFEAVAALEGKHGSGTDVQEGLDRVDSAIEELVDDPLERAIETDERAREAEDPDGAVADYRLARQRYLETLELDEDAPEKRFAGDTDRIEERVETVTERIISIARDDGAEALGAGKWFLEADRPAVAREESLVARAIFEDAVAVARDARPEEVGEFEAWLADAEGTVTAATEAVDEDVTPGTVEQEVDGWLTELAGQDDALAWADGRPEHAGSEATDGETVDADANAPPGGDAEARPDAADADEIVEDAAAKERDDEEAEGDRAPTDDADGGGGTEDGRQDPPGTVVSDGVGGATMSTPQVSLKLRVRALDPEGFEGLARELLAAEGWEVSEAPAEAPCDLQGTPTEPGNEPIAVWIVHRPMAGPVDVDQVRDVVAAATEVSERGAIVTSSPTTAPARSLATRESLTILDRPDIAEAVDGPLPDLFQRVRPGPD